MSLICFAGMMPTQVEKQSHAFGINDILLLWKITAFFDNGVECREALDAIIDRCSALQNIRQAVLEYRKVFNQQHVEPRVRRVALYRGAEYLERYFRLIAFAAYLGSEAFDGFCGQGEYKMAFKNWMHERPEVQAMKWSIRLRPGRFFTVPVIFFSYLKLFFSCPQRIEVINISYCHLIVGRVESTTRISAWRCSNGGFRQSPEWFCSWERLHTENVFLSWSENF